MIKAQRFERVPLPGGEALPLGWFAVSWTFVGDATSRRRMRSHWYRVRSDYGTVYRVLRFAANLSAGGETQAAAIAIDYQGWWELQGLNVPELDEIELTIDRIGVVGAIIGMCRHPEPTHRTAFLLALWSVALGFMSLVITLL